MEAVQVRIDPDEYDRILAESRAAGTMEHGDLRFIVKPGATQSGRSAVLITFSAQINGERVQVQAACTGRNLQQVARFVQSVEDTGGLPRTH